MGNNVKQCAKVSRAATVLDMDEYISVVLGR